MFKVGQKVVCIAGFMGPINEGPHKGKTSRLYPKKGSIYVIEEIFPDGFLAFHGLYYNEFGGIASFNPAKFRPLDYDWVEEVIKQVQPEKQPA